VLTVPVVIYVALYVVIFSGRGEYYDLGSHVVTKVPHLWACFSLIGSLDPHEPGFGAMECLGLALLTAAAAWTVRSRNRLALLGFGWFFLSLLPVLPISWIATRYTTAPLVGFVMVVVGLSQSLSACVPPVSRRAVRTGLTVAATVALVVNLTWIRGELTDMRAQTAVYDRLLGEVVEVAPFLGGGLPLVCVRIEARNLLHEIDEGGYAGINKTQFIRQLGPYGLASWAPLLTFARAGQGDELFLVADPKGDVLEDFLVIAHAAGRFELPKPTAQTLADELEGWRRAGFWTEVIAPAR
jgi:hypothetical protein